MNSRAFPQGGGGAIECPDAVVEGGTITITVGPNDTTLTLKETGGDTKLVMPVQPGKTVTVPVPSLRPGATLTVILGNRERKRGRAVEVLSPSP
jgi:hypothetical protein